MGARADWPALGLASTGPGSWFCNREAKQTRYGNWRRSSSRVQRSGVLQADGGWTLGEPGLGVPALCRTVLLDCNRLVQDVLEDDPLAEGPALPRRAELEKTGARGAGT